MRVDVLVLDDVFDLWRSSILDVLQTANELAEASGLSVRFEVRMVGMRKTVKTSQGLTVRVQPAGRRPADCIVVPAIGFKMPEPLEAALARPDVREAAGALRQWSRSGATMAAACIGTFALADSGLP